MVWQALVLVSLLAATAGEFVPTPRTSHQPCPQGKFDCRNGKCISGSVWCDGIDNCGNNADELTCRVCLGGSIKCKKSNQCVSVGSRCNGKTECQDGSDEAGCETIITEVQVTTESASAPAEIANEAPMLLHSPVIVLVSFILLIRLL